jgi:prepilin-type N-terminal cleavage/methylation domain-containing protein
MGRDNAMSQKPNTSDRLNARRGFTLIELMVVMLIIGVMAAMSVPSFQRAIEQSRADIAVANLRAIWAAQRLYWLENGTYTNSLTDLRDIGVLDPSIPASVSEPVGAYGYEVSDATETAMTAKAVREGTTHFFSISETGVVSGTVTVGGSTVTPGFQ